MGSVFEEMNRRGVIRVGLAYIVIGWVMLQIAGILVPSLDLPDIVLEGVTAIVILCFPLVIVLSWAVDLTDGGVRLSYNVKNENEALARKTEAAKAVVEATEIKPFAAAASVAPGEKSIAVLPFSDISTGHDQEHLSDGVAEEIRNMLQRIPGLHVVGRDSCRAFKGENQDGQTIGTLLRATHVMEGAVRRQGDNLHVTAQLVKVSSGFQLWSKSYSRSLRDIFQVQEDIAAAIASELHLPFSKETKDDNARKLTANEKAYALYMEGKSLLNLRLNDSLNQAIALFEQAVELDPSFTRAWSAMAEAYVVLPTHRNVVLSEAQAAAERCCRMAISTDENFAEPLSILGHVFMQHRAYTAMQESLDRAFALDPDDLVSLHHAGVAMINVGRINEAARHFQHLHDLDPMMPFALSGLAVTRLLAGDLAAAEKYASRVVALGFTPAKLTLAEVAGENGDLEKACNLFEEAMQSGIVHEFLPEQIPVLARGVYFEDSRAEALEIVEEYVRNPAPETEDFAPVLLLKYGDIEAAFDVFARNKFAFDAYFYGCIWSPSGKSARQHPGFKDFLRRVGLVDYWLLYGWADKCRPVGNNDFEVD